MNYLRRFLDASDPGASLKHAAYALVVACSCWWLTWEVVSRPMSANWVAAFGILVAGVVTGKVVGASASPAPAGDCAGSGSTGGGAK
jgi:hypothetical protein